MEKVIAKVILIAASLLSAACTHTLYQAELDAFNAKSDPVKTVIYWSKTSPLLGVVKAGPIMLLSECSTRRLDFVDSEQGIVFWGKLGGDTRMGEQTPLQGRAVCGSIGQYSSIVDIETGRLPVTIHCQAFTDAFALSSPPYTDAYLAAQSQPYWYDVKSTSHWTFWGEVPIAPPAPACHKP